MTELQVISTLLPQCNGNIRSLTSLSREELKEFGKLKEVLEISEEVIGIGQLLCQGSRVSKEEKEVYEKFLSFLSVFECKKLVPWSGYDTSRALVVKKLESIGFGYHAARRVHDNFMDVQNNETFPLLIEILEGKKGIQKANEVAYSLAKEIASHVTQGRFLQEI